MPTYQKALFPKSVLQLTTFVAHCRLRKVTGCTKGVKNSCCKCFVPSQIWHLITSQLILLLLGYTGDLTVALEPPEGLRPASEDSLHSGDYLPCVSFSNKFLRNLPTLTFVFTIDICICLSNLSQVGKGSFNCVYKATWAEQISGIDSYYWVERAIELDEIVKYHVHE